MAGRADLEAAQILDGREVDEGCLARPVRSRHRRAHRNFLVIPYVPSVHSLPLLVSSHALAGLLLQGITSLFAPRWRSTGMIAAFGIGLALTNNASISARDMPPESRQFCLL
jgi:hypothetical protein